MNVNSHTTLHCPWTVLFLYLVQYTTNMFIHNFSNWNTNFEIETNYLFTRLLIFLLIDILLCFQIFASGRSFDCQLCSESFATMPLLSQHYDSGHIVQRPRACTLPCSLCDKKFASQRGLQGHLFTAHGQGKPCLKCPICGQGFAWPSAKQRHMKKEHPQKAE